MFYLLFLVLYKLLIKLRIEVVKILFIQLGLYLFQRLPETLEMHDFPGPEEFKGFSYLRVSMMRIRLSYVVLAFCSAARSS